HGHMTLERVGSSNTESFLLATFAPLPAPEVAPPAETVRQADAAAGHETQAEVQPAEAARAPLASDLPADGAQPTERQPAAPVAAAERRQPLRFVWQIDHEGRFTVASDDFLTIIGPGVAARLGRPWQEAADELALDPDGRLAQALASHDTFSGIVVTWPIEGTADRLGAELSGLPVFGLGRTLRGFRGFRVCRDVARMAAIAAARRSPFVAPRHEAGRNEAAREVAPSDVPPPDVAPSEPPASLQPEQASGPGPAEHDAAAAAAPANPDAPASSDAPAPVESATPPADRPQLTVVPA